VINSFSNCYIDAVCDLFKLIGLVDSEFIICTFVMEFLK
jgi:hypothetical protein